MHIGLSFRRGYVKGFNLAQMTLHYGSQGNLQVATAALGYCTLESFYNTYNVK